LVAAGLAGCGGKPAVGDDAVTIGLIAPQTGPLLPIGTEVLNAFHLYLSMHGQKLGGHPVTVATGDEGDGTAVGAVADTLIKKDHVVALVGVVNAAAAQTVAQKANAARVPFIGVAGRPSTLDNLSYVWHTSFLSREFGEAIAGYLHEQIPGPVYVIGPDYAGGKEQIGGFVDAFRAAGGVLANPGGQPDWTPFPATTNFGTWLAKIKASGAKAVYAFYAGTPAWQFVKQYDEFGLHNKIPLWGSGVLTEGSALTNEGQAAVGVVTVANYVADLDNAANRGFVDGYQKAYKTSPTFDAMDAWDGLAVLDRAISTLGGTVTSARINTAMGSLGQIDSPRGQWSFSKKTHTPVQDWYAVQVGQDGPVLANRELLKLTTLGAG
jgi:branched-chain amino acid transport system substrate-binding protein